MKSIATNTEITQWSENLETVTMHFINAKNEQMNLHSTLEEYSPKVLDNSETPIDELLQTKLDAMKTEIETREKDVKSGKELLDKIEKITKSLKEIITAEEEHLEEITKLSGELIEEVIKRKGDISDEEKKALTSKKLKYTKVMKQKKSKSKEGKESKEEKKEKKQSKRRKSQIPEGMDQLLEDIKKKEKPTKHVVMMNKEEPKHETKVEQKEEVKEEIKEEVKEEVKEPPKEEQKVDDIMEEEPKPKRLPSKMKQLLGSESTKDILSILNKDGRDGVIEGINSNKATIEKWCECEQSKVIFDSKDTNGQLKDFTKTIMNLSYLCIMAVTGDDVIGCFVRKPIDTINKPISDYKHFIFTFKTGDPLNINRYLPKGDNWQHAFTIGANDSSFVYKINTTSGAEICNVGENTSKLINITTAYENAGNDMIFSILKNKSFITERIVVLQLY